MSGRVLPVTRCVEDRAASVGASGSARLAARLSVSLACTAALLAGQPVTTPRAVAATVTTSATTTLSTSLPTASAPATGDDTGRLLFEGRRPLTGRVGGHSEALPAEALVCANCHRTRPGTPGRLAGGGRDAGSMLNATTLLGALERRGGPPSRYDRDAFCGALRAGVDPAGVVLPRVMPRYAIDAPTCDALWRYLTAGGG